MIVVPGPANWVWVDWSTHDELIEVPTFVVWVWVIWSTEELTFGPSLDMAFLMDPSSVEVSLIVGDYDQ